MAIEDVREGQVHVVHTPTDLEPWLKSFKAGECVQPAFGMCGRCNGIHSDRDIDGEVFASCVRCHAELVEVALELRDEQEAEG